MTESITELQGQQKSRIGRIKNVKIGKVGRLLNMLKIGISMKYLYILEAMEKKTRPEVLTMTKLILMLFFGYLLS